jgi:hypothetical protein
VNDTRLELQVFEMREGARHQNDVEPALADDLVGDADVAALCVTRLN